MRTTNRIRALLLAALGIAATGVPGAIAQEGSTLSALELAYSREVNARLHYVAFAEAARREGYQRIWCLFCSVAEGESIHARNLRVQIEKQDGVLRPEIESVVVRSTVENLAACIERERREWQSVYPQLAEFARKEYLQDARMSFEYARSAEHTHEEIFTRALSDLRAYESGPGALASLEPVSLDESKAKVGPLALICPECGSACVAPASASHCGCGTSVRKLLVPCCTR